MTTYTRPDNDPHDWATINRWIDAGKPEIDPETGTWIDAPALAASARKARNTMTETLISCAKPGCGFATEGRTPREAQHRMNLHMSRTDHSAFAHHQHTRAAALAAFDIELTQVDDEDDS